MIGRYISRHDNRMDDAINRNETSAGTDVGMKRRG